jgi:hypothetical protein
MSSGSTSTWQWPERTEAGIGPAEPCPVASVPTLTGPAPLAPKGAASHCAW